MLELTTRTGLALALALTLAAGACSSERTEKSTGSNWIECQTDADCALYAGATCGEESVCVDPSGNKIPRSALVTDPDAGGAAGGATGSGGTDAGAPDGSGGGAAGSGGARGSGGATASGGAAASGGASAGDGGAVATGDCYSPGQNLDRAYEPGAVGCECPADAPDLCLSGVALVCDGGRWQAVEDGPCMPGICWTPGEPDAAASRPLDGCACTSEGQEVCLHTYRSGYMTATCTDGKWTASPQDGACGCTSDAHCGFGSRCEAGQCLPGTCEVNGVRYAIGVGKIPDPSTCNRCVCETQGRLSCTLLPCPLEPPCPDGTVAASVCIACGPAGGCSISRTGCLPRCEANDDCAATYTPICDPDQQACSAGPCF